MFKHAIFKLLFSSLLLTLSLAAKATPIDILFHRSIDPVIGNPEGQVTIVEFFDYRCGHCANMANVIANAIRVNPHVRVVFKDYPIRGNMSQYAARAAVAAHYQGKYYPFSHTLLTTNRPLTRESILEIAKALGLNIEQLKTDMFSSKVTGQLNGNINLARELKLAGTPSFYIGKTNATADNEINFVLGEMSAKELQNAINKASR